MDIIAMTRELGKALQKDESYLKLEAANDKCNANQELQKAIDDFNAMRAALQAELAKENRDDSKVREMDTQFRELYRSIMQVPEMVEYNRAKAEIDRKLAFISQIITSAANGIDPDTVEEEEEGCTGSCASCGGCH